MTARAPASAAIPPLAASKDAAAAAAPKEVPDIIVDPNTKRRYERGKFLGKGGFAKCYELKDLATGELLAGKIVPKSMLTKTHQKEKMSQVKTTLKSILYFK
jgi:polo-like kinase 1